MGHNNFSAIKCYFKWEINLYVCLFSWSEKSTNALFYIFDALLVTNHHHAYKLNANLLIFSTPFYGTILFSSISQYLISHLFRIHDILLQDANCEDTQIVSLQYLYAFLSSRLKSKGFSSPHYN